MYAKSRANEIQRYFSCKSNPSFGNNVTKTLPTQVICTWFYTGIGGGIGDVPGLEDESVLDSAYRELEEETNKLLTKENIELHEFARCIYDTGTIVYYLWGISTMGFPTVSLDDGQLIQVPTVEVLKYEFIPSAGAVMSEWAKRKFATDQKFTVFAKELGVEKTVRLIEVLEISDGLY